MRKDEVSWLEFCKALFALVSLFAGTCVILFAAIQWLPIWVSVICFSCMLWSWGIAEGFAKQKELEKEEDEQQQKKETRR